MESLVKIWGIFLNTMFIVGVFNAANILIGKFVNYKDRKGLHTEELTLAINVIIIIVMALLMI